MSYIVYLHTFNCGFSRFTQKCLIPLWLLEKTNFRVGDIISIKGYYRAYICKVHVTILPLNFIFLDDTVTCENFSASRDLFIKDSITFPDNIKNIEAGIFDNIHVRLVFEDYKILLNCDKSVYENVVHKILNGFIIMRNCSINCKGLKLADLFKIHSIFIEQAFQNETTHGKIIKSSTVVITGVQCLNQIIEIKEMQGIVLGGICNSLNFLKLNICFNRCFFIFVSGPSGCGKSSFVNKFCCSYIPYYIVIDGLVNGDINLEKCNMYYEYFSSYLNVFPDKKCVLFIDHIDVIAPYSKQKNSSSVSALVDLTRRLTKLHVIIIAAAVYKKAVDSKISSLFNEEINLGIPSFQQRKEIIEAQVKMLNCSTVDCDKIARMTPGFVGHDITIIFKKAIDYNSENSGTCLTTEDVERSIVDYCPSILKTSLWNIKVQPIYWKDIGGMFTVKQRLQMCIEWPLRNPKIFKKLDLPCPHGVLLFGPPGCCKTTLARGLATECNANFFAANPAQIYSPYVGESEKNIIELFCQARLCAPSIIFLDELDSLVSQRKLDSKSEGIGEKVLSTLLNEMDGFGSKLEYQSYLNTQTFFNTNEAHESINKGDREWSNEVIVVAATNRPDLIDDALLRPGRFDIILYVPPPDVEERKSILETLTCGMPLKDVDFNKIVKNTEYYSGADLKNLCNEAAMNALRKDISASYITEDNFDQALKKIKPSITKQQLKMYEKLSRKYGVVKAC